MQKTKRFGMFFLLNKMLIQFRLSFSFLKFESVISLFEKIVVQIDNKLNV